jgi:hypothetical protein
MGRFWARLQHLRATLKGALGSTRTNHDFRAVEQAEKSREHFGESAALIGFGTHTGTVAAASEWDGPMEIKRVLPSRRDSYERLMHDSGQNRFLLEFSKDEALRRRLLEQRLARLIGVIYRPDTELFSHYASTSLPQQFDALVWFDETRAVTPLSPEHLSTTAVPDEGRRQNQRQISLKGSGDIAV